MYASVRRYTVGAGSVDALVHRVDEEFVPALAQEPGFMSYFVLETGDRMLESISIFADQASAERSEELAAEYVSENLADFALTRIDAVTGEVLVSRATPETLTGEHRWFSARARARGG